MLNGTNQNHSIICPEPADSPPILPQTPLPSINQNVGPTIPTSQNGAESIPALQSNNQNKEIAVPLVSNKTSDISLSVTDNIAVVNTTSFCAPLLSKCTTAIATTPTVTSTTSSQPSISGPQLLPRLAPAPTQPLIRRPIQAVNRGVSNLRPMLSHSSVPPLTTSGQYYSSPTLQNLPPLRPALPLHSSSSIYSSHNSNSTLTPLAPSYSHLTTVHQHYPNKLPLPPNTSPLTTTLATHQNVVRQVSAAPAILAKKPIAVQCEGLGAVPKQRRPIATSLTTAAACSVAASPAYHPYQSMIPPAAYPATSLPGTTPISQGQQVQLMPMMANPSGQYQPMLFNMMSPVMAGNQGMILQPTMALQPFMPPPTMMSHQQPPPTSIGQLQPSLPMVTTIQQSPLSQPTPIFYPPLSNTVMQPPLTTVATQSTCASPSPATHMTNAPTTYLSNQPAVYQSHATGTSIRPTITRAVAPSVQRPMFNSSARATGCVGQAHGFKMMQGNLSPKTIAARPSINHSPLKSPAKPPTSVISDMASRKLAPCPQDPTAPAPVGVGSCNGLFGLRRGDSRHLMSPMRRKRAAMAMMARSMPPPTPAPPVPPPPPPPVIQPSPLTVYDFSDKPDVVEERLPVPKVTAEPVTNKSKPAQPDAPTLPSPKQLEVAKSVSPTPVPPTDKNKHGQSSGDEESNNPPAPVPTAPVPCNPSPPPAVPPISKDKKRDAERISRQEKKRPVRKKAIVRPEKRRILTHLIDNHVIYESNKPFPVKRAMEVVEATLLGQLHGGKTARLSTPVALSSATNSNEEADSDVRTSEGPESPALTTDRDKSSVMDPVKPTAPPEMLIHSITSLSPRLATPTPPQPKYQQPTSKSLTPQPTPVSTSKESAPALAEVCDPSTWGDIRVWSVEQVYDFVNSTPGCQAYANSFRGSEVDGEALLLLAEDHLIQPPISMKVGPALKLSARIEQLRS